MIQLLKDQFWINVEAWRIWADKKTTQWDPCKDRAQMMSLSLPGRPHSQWEILKENLWKNCGLEDWILRVRREGVRSCVEQTLGRRGIFGEQGCMIKTEKKGRQSPGSYWIISNGPLCPLSPCTVSDIFSAVFCWFICFSFTFCPGSGLGISRIHLYVVTTNFEMSLSLHSDTMKSLS